MNLSETKTGGSGHAPNKVFVEWMCIAGILLLYVFGFLLYYPRVVTVTDESDYLGRAKAFSEGRAQYVSPMIASDGQNEIASRYPAGTSLAIAPLFRLGGLRLAFAFPLIMLVATILVTAGWIHDQGRSPAFALLLLSFPPFLVLGRVSMSGMPSALIIVCGMWCFWRGLKGGFAYPYISGFLAGISVMYRETNCLLFVPLFVGSVIRREQQAVWIIAGGLCGLGVHVSTSLVLSDNLLHGGRSMGFSMQSMWQHLLLYSTALTVLVPGGLVWALLYRGRRRLELISTVGLFFLFFSLYNYSGQQSGALKALILGPRFFIPLLPLLAFQAAEVVPRLWSRLLPSVGSKAAKRLRLAGIVVVAGYMISLAGIAFGCHPLFSGWNAHHVRTRALIYAETPDDSVILTDLTATEKYINELYGKRTTLQYSRLEPGELKHKLTLHKTIWIVVLERNDSVFWKKRSAHVLEFVKSLVPSPQLLLTEDLGSSDRLWIWKLQQPLPYGSSDTTIDINLGGCLLTNASLATVTATTAPSVSGVL